MLLLPIALLLVISIKIIYDVHGINRAVSQASWVALSSVAFLLVSAIDYKILIKYAIPIYSFSLLSLVLVLLTPPINGAHSWFRFAGMSIQPSEFTKPALVLMLAAYLPFKDFYKSLPGLVPPLALTLLPFALIILQPDLGTALVLIPIFLVIVLLAGVKLKHIAILALLTILASPLMYLCMEDHQKNRIHAFIWPKQYKKTVNLHLKFAKIAIGSGGISGFSPEDDETLPHNVFKTYAATDYSFALIGEKFGFLGTVFVLMLYLLVFFELFRMMISVRHPNERLIVVGVFATLSAQSLVHIGGNLDLIPFTGVPLPFLSAGGSSIMSSAISIALIVNIGLRRKTFFGRERSATNSPPAK